jgi:integrase
VTASQNPNPNTAAQSPVASRSGHPPMAASQSTVQTTAVVTRKRPGWREVIEGKPKSRAGDRRIWLDATTVALLKAHRKVQLADRLRASSAWQDNDLMFCRADGSPWTPDYVTHRFRKLAVAAGVPVIKLHEGRHSAASLQRDAEVDPETRRKTMGHADQAMTSHYTHIEAEAHRAAAEAVARLVDGAGS